MLIEATYQTLFQQMDKSTTIITPNRRLSATLHKLYQQFQSEHKKIAWETPDILPVSTWIQRLWYQYTSEHFVDAPMLLNAVQEHFLWENIILSTKESIPLLRVPETAEMAKSAWGLLKQWLVNVEHPTLKNTDDHDAAFYHWAKHFQKTCQDKAWVDTVGLTDLVIEKMSMREITPDKTLHLIGFSELSPQLKKLFSYCKTNTEEMAMASTSRRISLKDAEQEWLTMARWAKETFNKNKSARIGCVIPSLDKARDRIVQLFSALLTDESFNISAGKSLLQYPVIYTALQLLSFHKKTISFDLFSSLLTSPFLGKAESERIKRALLESLLRKENSVTVHLTTDVFKKNCPLLAKKIQAFFDIIDTLPEKMTYCEWAATFHRLLLALGWPGERSLNSEEYQIIEQWLKLLQAFSTLDQITHPTTLHHAWHALQKIASQTVFQPKTPDAPIQVLGLLEAAGLHFDYLWVAGMDDMSWPPQPKPNPLIPKRLQRELQMPHATAERELSYCKQLTQQFQQKTMQLIFSHAEKNDELELQPSPLIRNIAEITIHDLHLAPYQSLAEQLFASKKISSIVDEIAPPPHSDKKILGGVNILKQQALCPFKAFAECRLHARELENISPGLRTKDRGSILHKVMEILWNNLHDHATLCQYDENELKNKLHMHINEALAFFPISQSNKPQYLALEKKRLHRLLWDWLLLEKQRPPFKVLTSEKSAEMILNQLSLTVRIDRIDELEDGKKLIIDYKTGKNNEVNRWFGARPEEPQLPLYALLNADHTVGITYAQITPGDNGFKGISQYALDIKGITNIAESKKATATAWPDQLIEWHSTLGKLSNDFYAGISAVDPKNAPETCEWCGLKPFCRIKENQHV